MEKRLVLGCWISVLWRSDNFATEQSVIFIFLFFFTLLPFIFFTFFIAGACVFDHLFNYLFFIYFHFFVFSGVLLLEWVPFCFVCRCWSLFTPTLQPDYKHARCGFILLTDWESCHTHNTETMTHTHPLPFSPVSIVSVHFSSFSSSLCLSSIVSLL